MTAGLFKPRCTRYFKAVEGIRQADFRYPDDIRLGVAPIYTLFVKIHEGIMRMRRVLVERLYEKYPVGRPEVT